VIYRLLYKLLHDQADIRDRVGTRIYAENVPAGVQGECIVIRLISGEAQNHLANEADLAQRDVQIDFYAARAAAAESGFELVRLLLSGFSGEVDVLNDQGSVTAVEVSSINLLRPGMFLDAPTDGTDVWTKRFSGDFEVFHSQDVPTHV
jgi:hypothetical protein